MKSKPHASCFTCGANLSKLSADQVGDHMLIHKRDEIIAEYPVLLTIDEQIGEKYGAEIQIMFKETTK